MRTVTWMASFLRLAAAMVIAGMSAPALGQVALHVDGSVTSPGDGLSWATAMNDLQAAIDAASASSGVVTEIRLADGTYIPSARVDPADARSATFRLLPNLTIKGGFAGVGAPNPDAWDPEAHVSALSGDLADDDSGAAPGPDNAYHVVLWNTPKASAELIGLRIEGGNADVENVETRTHLGGGVLCFDAAMNVRACSFTRNFAINGGGMYARSTVVNVDECRFTENSSKNGGMALRLFQAPGSQVRNCQFTNHVRTSTGKDESSGVAAIYGSIVTIEGCSFTDNRVVDGGPTLGFDETCDGSIISNCVFARNLCAIGGGMHSPSSVEVQGCTFQGNSARILGGGAIVGAGSVIDRCIFDDNDANWYGGGSILAMDDVTISNSLIALGQSSNGGGVFSTGMLRLINCTVVDNVQYGVIIAKNGSIEASNCVFRGNLPGQIAFVDEPEPPAGGDGSTAILQACNIEGGWSGAGIGNIDVNPQFVQPGCGNYRLRNDSPCINAGNSSLVPANILVDLDGEPRFQDGAVDIGAHEGSEQPMPMLACLDSIIPLTPNYMVPAGGLFEPFLRAGARVNRQPTSPNGTATLEQTSQNLHLGVGGFSELCDILRYQCTVPSGQHKSAVVLPFDQSRLGLLDFEDIDITVFDPVSDDWILAVSANIGDSIHGNGPIGTRHLVVGTDTEYGNTNALGDYGVFWNPELQRGFAWANVDHIGDFGLGARLPECPSDCAPPHDGLTDQYDILEVVSYWGIAVPGLPSDTNADFVVDVRDLLLVIANWGPCP